MENLLKNYISDPRAADRVRTGDIELGKNQPSHPTEPQHGFKPVAIHPHSKETGPKRLIFATVMSRTRLGPA